MANAKAVESLGLGDHACLTFSDPEERLDLLAAFLRDGIAHGDKVVCYTESLCVDELTRELRGRSVAAPAGDARPGQFEVRRGERSWAPGADMVDTLATEVQRARAQGFRGLRVGADMCWAVNPGTAAEELLVFESEVGRLFRDGRLTAVCQYDRHSFDPVTLAFAARTHPMTVAATAYHEDPVLRICRQHVPPGVRVAGELDFAHAGTLQAALADAARLDRDVHVNLNGLRFLDAAAAGVVLRTAAGLGADRRTVVVCPPQVGRVLVAAGAGDIAGLRILVRDGEI